MDEKPIYSSCELQRCLNDVCEEKFSQKNFLLMQDEKPKYSSCELERCLNDVREGKLSQKKAATKYGIPRSTIYDKIKGKSPPGVCTRGPQPLLGRDCEQMILEWARKCNNRGFTITKDNLTFTIKKISESIPHKQKEKLRVKDELGINYVGRFLKRYKKEIKLKRAHSLQKARNNVSEQDIRQWFTQIEKILKMENCFDALEDPRRVFSTSETAIYLNSQGRKFVGTTRKSAVRVNDKDDESNVTVLFTASADGSQVPPFVLLKYKRIPGNITAKCPDRWVIGCNENGKMTSEKFYEYVKNIFDLYLETNNIQRPVIVFMDGHPSHQSVPLSNFCAEKGIVLVGLIASGSQILQPLNDSFLRPLNVYWRKHLKNYRLNNNHDIDKSDMAKEMEKVLTDHELNLKLSIRRGFQTTGLYPFDVNNVSFENLTLQQNDEFTFTEDSLVEFSPIEYPPVESPPIQYTPKFTLLQLFESQIPPDILTQFYECKTHGKWRGDSKFSGCFEIWLDVHSREESYYEYVLYESVKSNNTCENIANSHNFSTPVPNSALNFNDDENYDNDYDDRKPIAYYHLVHPEQHSLESDIDKNKENVTFVSTSDTDYNVHISIPPTSFSNDTQIDSENSQESNVVVVPSTSTEELDLDLENMEVENVGMESLLEENRVDGNIDCHFTESNNIVSTNDRTNVELRGQNSVQPSVQLLRSANVVNRTSKRLSIFINF